MTTNALEYFEKKLGKLTFGKMLWSLRKCDEISQTEFAKKLGVSKQYLCDIEKERTGVSVEKAQEMAKTLGYSEKQFIRLALQDQLTHAGIKFEIHLEEPYKNAA
ncbi:MAG: helix-turn-helix transcriptional regulator [Gammaproteobacteria bacterium]|nr:helix-turn-helix transcriptional regulator [Gammaproteobacteria bacterium]